MMTTRRARVGALAGVFVGAPATLRAQSPCKVYRVGVTSATVRFDAAETAFVWNPFRLELQRLGSSEGHHIADRRALFRGIGARRFLRRDRCTQSGGRHALSVRASKVIR